MYVNTKTLGASTTANYSTQREPMPEVVESKRFKFLSQMAAFLEKHLGEQGSYYCIIQDALEIDTRSLIQLREHQEWRQLEEQMFLYEMELTVCPFHDIPSIKPSGKGGLITELLENNRRISSAYFFLDLAVNNHFRVVWRTIDDQNNTILRLNEFLKDPLLAVAAPLRIPKFPVPSLPDLEKIKWLE